jgi:hypothetical protein
VAEKASEQSNFAGMNSWGNPNATYVVVVTTSQKSNGFVEFPGSNQPTGVGDVGHEESTVLIRDRSKFTVVPVPRVRRSATDDQFWFEETGLGCQGVVVDQDLIRRGYRTGRDWKYMEEAVIFFLAVWIWVRSIQPHEREMRHRNAGLT